VLHADRPVTTFGYFREDVEREARDGAAWQCAGRDRWLLLPEESLRPCFDRDSCTPLGMRHRRSWYLAPPGGRLATCGCGNPPPG